MYPDDKEYMENVLDMAEKTADKVMEKTGEFFKKAFEDMAQSAREQHEVDKANFEAVKMESKARWEEAKLAPRAQAQKLREEREKQLEESRRRIDEARRRMDSTK